MILTIGILLMVVGLAMIGFWVFHISKGGLPQGIRTLESGGYLVFHITAELITGVLCMLGGLALILTLKCGIPVALFASGMLAYTGMNSLAWNEVKNKPVLSLMFLVPLVIAVVSGVYLIVAILS